MTIGRWAPLAFGLIANTTLGAAPPTGVLSTAPTPAAIQSFTLKGNETVSSSFERGTFEVWCQFPDKFVRRTQLTYQERGGVASAWSEDVQTTILGFNGDHVIYQGALALRGGRQTQMGYMPSELRQADVQPLLPYARRDFALLVEVLFQGDAAGLANDAVWDRVRVWAKPPSYAPFSALPPAIRGDYSDYRLIDGVRVPFRITHAVAEQEWTLDSIRWNVPIDAKKFKPTAATAR